MLQFLIFLVLLSLKDVENFFNAMIDLLQMTGFEPMFKSAISELTHENVPMVKMRIGLSFGDA
jgi:hypothetical protein